MGRYNRHGTKPEQREVLEDDMKDMGPRTNGHPTTKQMTLAQPYRCPTKAKNSEFKLGLMQRTVQRKMKEMEAKKGKAVRLKNDFRKSVILIEKRTHVGSSNRSKRKKMKKNTE